MSDAKKAIFLDRDGVVNELVTDPKLGTPESPYYPEDLQLTAGAAEAIKLLQTAGYLVVVVSNQPAAAKATVSLDGLKQVHQKVVDQLAEADVQITGYYYCFHHPKGVVPELTGVCECRKPGTGLLRQAASEHSIDLKTSWMIGDSDTDIQAAQDLGVNSVLVENSDSAHRRQGAVIPDLHAKSLLDAAKSIVAA